MLSSALLSPLGQTKIYLYAKPADMRKSFNGLHAIVAAEFGCDIRAGNVSERVKGFETTAVRN